MSGKAEVQGDRACLGQEETGEGGRDRTMGAMWRIAVSPDGLWEATEGSYRCGGWEWSPLM